MAPSLRPRKEPTSASKPAPTPVRRTRKPAGQPKEATIREVDVEVKAPVRRRRTSKAGESAQDAINLDSPGSEKTASWLNPAGSQQSSEVDYSGDSKRMTRGRKRAAFETPSASLKEHDGVGDAGDVEVNKGEVSSCRGRVARGMEGENRLVEIEEESVHRGLEDAQAETAMGLTYGEAEGDSRSKGKNQDGEDTVAEKRADVEEVQGETASAPAVPELTPRKRKPKGKKVEEEKRVEEKTRMMDTDEAHVDEEKVDKVVEDVEGENTAETLQPQVTPPKQKGKAKKLEEEKIVEEKTEKAIKEEVSNWVLSAPEQAHEGEKSAVLETVQVVQEAAAEVVKEIVSVGEDKVPNGHSFQNLFLQQLDNTRTEAELDNTRAEALAEAAVSENQNGAAEGTPASHLTPAGIGGDVSDQIATAYVESMEGDYGPKAMEVEGQGTGNEVVEKVDVKTMGSEAGVVLEEGNESESEESESDDEVEKRLKEKLQTTATNAGVAGQDDPDESDEDQDSDVEMSEKPLEKGEDAVLNVNEDDHDSEEDDEALAALLAQSMCKYLTEPSSLSDGAGTSHAETAIVTRTSRDGEEEDGMMYINNNRNIDAAEAAAKALKTVWTPAETGLSKIDGTTSLIASKDMPQNLWQAEKKLLDGLLVPPLDAKKQRKLAKKNVKETSGAKWFDMPAPTVTPELKKEIQLLKLRKVIDPKRHYKADDTKGIPKYFQIGTVVEGHADFYSGRLTKKERKQTFADELLANTQLKSYRKRKYTEIQEEKQAGGKKFYKQKKNRQKPSWAKT